MKPAQFSYHAPKTIDEALALLARVAPDDGRVLAGGQSLVPTMAFRLARPRHLIDINGVAGLDRLAVESGRLCVGARVRHAAFEKPAEPGALGKLLSKVVQHIAHHPIRTRGTMCGSLAHADPASEWCAVAAMLDAEMIARSARGTRTIAAKDYFQGIMTTALAEDELLAEVRLPLLPAETRTGFAEFNRRAGDFAFAMAVFAYRVKDIQLNGNDVNGNGVLFNADKAEAYGLEAELEARPFENFTLSAGLSLLHSEIKDKDVYAQVCALNGVVVCTVNDPTITANTFAGPALFAQIDGNPLPNAPKYTANVAARYDVPLGVPAIGRPGVRPI